MSKYTDSDAAGRPRSLARSPANTCLRRLPLALMIAAASSSAVLAQQGEHRWPVVESAESPVPAMNRGSGALQVYVDRSGLLAAVDGIAISQEDFTGSLVPAGNLRVCYQAVGNRSDDPCFAPGDLVPGFGVRSSRGSIFDVNTVDVDIVALGEGFMDMPFPVIGNNVLDLPYNPLRIDFDPPVTIVGMDAFDGMQGGPVQIDAYDGDGALIGGFTVQPAGASSPAFAGFTSAVPVHRVDVNAQTDGGGELIGQLLFGGGAGRLASADAGFDLGTVSLGSGTAVEFELVNHGHLPVTGIQLPALPAPFQLTDDNCTGSSVPGGEACTIAIGVSGAAPGVHLATWHPGGDDDSAVALRADVVPARLQTAPGHLDFGVVAAGGTSAPQSVTVRNGTGASIATGIPVVLAAPFVRAGGDCPASGIELAPGASCQLDIVFSPQAAGDYDSELPLYNADGSPGGISLAGRGTGGAP